MDVNSALVEEINETIIEIGKIAHWLGLDDSGYDHDDFSLPDMVEDLFHILKANFGEEIVALTDEETLMFTHFRPLKSLQPREETDTP